MENIDHTENELNERNRSETSIEQINKGFVATRTLKMTIIKDIIQPQYISDIRKKFSIRDRWNYMNNMFMLLSKISGGASTVLSFVSVYKQDTMYAFLAGVMSTVGGIFNVFEIGASKKSKEQTNDINLLLKKLEIDDFPVLAEGQDEKNNNEEIEEVQPITENKISYDKSNEVVNTIIDIAPDIIKKTQKNKKNKQIEITQ